MRSYKFKYKISNQIYRYNREMFKHYKIVKIDYKQK